MTQKIRDYISGELIPNTPEERDAVQVMSRLLVEEYGYPKTYIQTRPQYRVKRTPSDSKKTYPVDIAVFTDSARSESTINMIVECKKKDRKDGIEQLQNYLTFTRANIGIWFNGEERICQRKVERDGKVYFEDIPDIPRSGERLEELGQYKRAQLVVPRNLKLIFKTIRNHLAANAVGATRDEILAQQIINLIFCKIYDEMYTKPNERVSFRAGIEEDPDGVAKRIHALFASVKAKYADVIDEGDTIDLKANTLAYVVGQLQRYSLREASRDAVAEAFETFIDGALKGGQGQFFTPRNVVRLLVKLADPSAEASIIDPACGSGGFLVESLRYVWEKLDHTATEFNWSEQTLEEERQTVATRQIVGIDKDGFLSKVTKVYMALLGDGRGGIFCEDSLAPPIEWGSPTQNRVQLGAFDVLLTNPPFGKEIQVTGEAKLAQFDLAHKWGKSPSRSGTDSLVPKGDLRSSARPEVLFIERGLQLLRKGGVMGIVLPETFFHAPNSKYIMQFLKNHNIRWIVDLPHNTFRPHNNAKCVALLLQKETPQDEVVNLAVAEQMGHDHQGKDMYRYDHIRERVDTTKVWDDIRLIINEIAAKRRDKYTFTVPADKLSEDDVYVPRYYWEAKDKEIERLAASKGMELTPLINLVEEHVIEHFDGHGSPKAEYKGKGDSPYVRVKDIVNWEIYKDPTARVPVHVYEDFVAAKKRLREADVLFVRRGSYRIGSVAIASPYDSECLLTREILVMRVVKQENPYGLSPYYLLYLLSHRLVQMQIPRKVLIETTLPNIGNRWSSLRLPIHMDQSVRDDVAKQVESVIRHKWKALALLDGLKRDHSELVT